MTDEEIRNTALSYAVKASAIDARIDIALLIADAVKIEAYLKTGKQPEGEPALKRAA